MNTTSSFTSTALPAREHRKQGEIANREISVAVGRGVGIKIEPLRVRSPRNRTSWKGKSLLSDLPARSFNNLDDPMRPRINQDSPAINNRIAVVGSSVFLGHIVIGDALSREIRADPNVALVGV